MLFAPLRSGHHPYNLSGPDPQHLGPIPVPLDVTHEALCPPPQEAPPIVPREEVYNFLPIDDQVVLDEILLVECQELEGVALVERVIQVL
jgi:hypothetical protein